MRIGPTTHITRKNIGAISPKIRAKYVMGSGAQKPAISPKRGKIGPRLL